MKKLILLSCFIALSCNNRQEHCSCFSSNYERTAKYTIGNSSSPSILLYVTDWKKVGSDTFENSLDCESNGRILAAGSKNAVLIPGENAYTVVEYKKIATCK